MSADHCWQNFFATIVCFSPFRVSISGRIASLVDFLHCLVCLLEIILLLYTKIKTWKKFRMVTDPGLKFRVVSLAARLGGAQSEIKMAKKIWVKGGFL